MEKEVKVFTAKERYGLGTYLFQSLALPFPSRAELRRSMISSRTKEALPRKKRGQAIRQAKGEIIRYHQITGKDDLIGSILRRRFPRV